MSTLDYQTPARERRRQPLSWWYAPQFVLLGLGISLMAFMTSGHGGDGVWLLYALTSPAIVCTLPFGSEGAFLIILPLAVIVQFTAYFAVLRTPWRWRVWAVLGFHLACCLAVQVWIGWM